MGETALHEKRAFLPRPLACKGCTLSSLAAAAAHKPRSKFKVSALTGDPGLPHKPGLPRPVHTQGLARSQGGTHVTPVTPQGVCVHLLRGKRGLAPPDQVLLSSILGSGSLPSQHSGWVGQDITAPCSEQFIHSLNSLSVCVWGTSNSEDSMETPGLQELVWPTKGVALGLGVVGTQDCLAFSPALAHPAGPFCSQSSNDNPPFCGLRSGS